MSGQVTPTGIACAEPANAPLVDMVNRLRHVAERLVNALSDIERTLRVVEYIAPADTGGRIAAVVREFTTEAVIIAEEHE